MRMLFPIGDDNIKGGYFPVFSYGLIAANVLVFIWQIRLGEYQEAALYHFGAIPREIVYGRDVYTLFTSIFLHGGLGHLFGNMLFLWIFADNIEARIGNGRFIVFYVLAGLMAHAVHIYFNLNSSIPTIGASGAISGVMGAYLVMFPSSRVRVLFFLFPFYIPAFLFLGVWIYMQVESGMGILQHTAAEDGVAYWAHIGGFVFGVLAGLAFRSLRREAVEGRMVSSDFVE